MKILYIYENVVNEKCVISDNPDGTYWSGLLSTFLEENPDIEYIEKPLSERFELLENTIS